MAETAEAKPSAAPGAAAAAAPASAAAPAAPSPGASGGDAGRLSGFDETETAAAVAAFDGPGQVPQIKPTTEAAAAKPADDPSSTAAPLKDGEAAPGADGKKADEAPVAEVLPFDEELAGLTPLGGEDEPSAITALAELTSEEAIQKACNPTGKLSDVEQLKHAQGLIGKFSQTVGAAAKLTAELRPFFQFDKAGNPAGFDIAAIADKMGKEAIDAQLTARGLKIVPKDWGATEASVDREYPRDLVESLVPGREMTFEEKVELIKSDPDKLVDLRIAKRERDGDAKRRTAAVAERSNREMEGRLSEITKTDKSIQALKPGMARWNKELPDTIGGALRADICYRLAKFDHLMSPAVRKAQGDTIYKRAEADFIKKHGLVMPVGGGGVVPAKGRPADAGFATVSGAAEAFG